MNPANYVIKTVTLNVKDLNNMKNFYQEYLGLALLSETATQARLGIAATQEELLILEQTNVANEQTSGLYHVAYLLPSRQALGEFLFHLIRKKYPLQGASDHGYSEAIYLADPEGNGIEVYRDKPHSEWVYQDNGIIVGVTEPMDADGVLNAAKNDFTAFLPGTFIGHVHLSVSEIAPTDDFFLNILDFTLTTRFGNHASFYGKDGYHHQFAGNIWQSRHLPNNKDNTPGLNEIKVFVSETVMTQTVQNLREQNWAHTYDETTLVFHDPNGIQFNYQLNQ